MKGPMGDGIMRGLGYTLGTLGGLLVILLLVLAMFKAGWIGLTRVQAPVDRELNTNADPYIEEEARRVRNQVIGSDVYVADGPDPTNDDLWI